MMRACLVLLLLSSAIAAAETADELKQQGLAAAQAKNWELARQKFEASYALAPHPFMLFNLATAQEQTERLVEARKSYATFLASSTAADEAKFRGIAKTKVASLDRLIPILEIRAAGFDADVRIELDSHAVETTTAIAVDPGEHTVAARRGGDVLAQRTIELARGSHETIELIPPPREVRPPPSAPPPRVQPVPPLREPAHPRKSVLASRWFWGAAAVVVVGAAAGGYVAAFGNPFAPDATAGTLGPTLRP